MINRFAFTFLLVATLVGFQNCTVNKGFGPRVDSQKAGAGGWPYEGKIFVAAELCSDGTPATKAKVFSDSESLLVKDACQNLQPPRSIQPSEIQIDPVDPQIVTISGRKFRLEPEKANPIQFVQKSEFWSSAGAMTMQGGVMPGTVSSGSLIICPVLYYWTSTASLVSLADNQGNVFRRAIGPFGPQIGISEQYTGEIWYAENSVGGANHQVTATFTSAPSGNQHLSCYEYSGVAHANSLEIARATYAVSSPTNQCRLDLGQISPNSSRSLLFVARWGDVLPNPSLGLTDRFNSTDAGGDRIIDSTSSFGVDFSCSQPFSSTVMGLTFKAFD